MDTRKLEHSDVMATWYASVGRGRKPGRGNNIVWLQAPSLRHIPIGECVITWALEGRRDIYGQWYTALVPSRVTYHVMLELSDGTWNDAIWTYSPGKGKRAYVQSEAGKEGKRASARKARKALAVKRALAKAEGEALRASAIVDAVVVD